MKSGRNDRIRLTRNFVILIVEISKPSCFLCQVAQAHLGNLSQSQTCAISVRNSINFHISMINVCAPMYKRASIGRFHDIEKLRSLCNLFTFNIDIFQEVKPKRMIRRPRVCKISMSLSFFNYVNTTCRHLRLHLYTRIYIT